MSAPYSSMRKDTNAQVWLWRRRRSLGLLLQCIIYGMLLVMVRADHHRDAEELHTLQLRPMAMADMYTIVFHKGLKTTSRRTAPILQLGCLKGCEYIPDMVRCTQVRVGEHGVWKCRGDLPKHLRFQDTRICCEGFESDDDDENILEGSCGLEFSIVLSTGGWPNSEHLHPGDKHKHWKDAEESEARGWTASWLIVLGVIAYLLYDNYQNWRLGRKGESIELRHHAQVLIDLISNARRLSWTGGGQSLSNSTSSGSSPCNSQK
ncbi:unnamed protein product [Sphagnum compactum]